MFGKGQKRGYKVCNSKPQTQDSIPKPWPEADATRNRKSAEFI